MTLHYTQMDMENLEHRFVKITQERDRLKAELKASHEAICIASDKLMQANAENETLREQLKDYCRDHATICYECGKKEAK